MGYMLKQLGENPTTHVKTHAEDCVKNWLNNQLRAKLADDQYNSKYHRWNIAKFKKKLSSNEDLPASLSEISAAHTQYLQELDDLQELDEA